MVHISNATIFIIDFLINLNYLNVMIGVIGNTINILVFTRWKLFRRNQLVFYLTVESIFNSSQLFLVTMTFMSASMFHFNHTKTSIISCKFLAYIIQSAQVISIITVCLAAIDQYISTNYTITVRQWSTLKLAQPFTCIMVLFSFIYTIPFLIYYEVRPKLDCTTFHPVSNYFYSFFHYCLYFIGILSIVALLLFSLLAYRNVRHLVRLQVMMSRRRRDRQLTAMILSRVILLAVTSIPYISLRIFEIYNTNMKNGESSGTIYKLINIILITINNVNYSVKDNYIC